MIIALKVVMQIDRGFCGCNTALRCLSFANENYLNRIPTRALLFAVISVIPCKWIFEKLLVIHLLL
jgi:hypothetical protein